MLVFSVVLSLPVRVRIRCSFVVCVECGLYVFSMLFVVLYVLLAFLYVFYLFSYLFLVVHSVFALFCIVVALSLDYC